MTLSRFHASLVCQSSRLAWLAALPLALMGACTSDASTGDEAVGSSAALYGGDEHEHGHDQPAPITWAACPSDFASECAWVPLPLDHAQPDGPAIPVFVSHTAAKSGTARAQMWLLQGGPGGSGNVFKDIVDQLFARLLPDVEFYVLEHRGVGESARLGCDAQENLNSESGPTITSDEWPACVQSLEQQWGKDKLADFTTTQDAHDLASLIERTREPGKQVFVYGVSYGTTRAMRFLQTHPHGADGVILDSIVSPSVEFLSQFDGQYDPVAKELFELCAKNDVCKEKLGGDPWGKLQALLGKLEQGHCPAFLHRSLVQPGFTQLLMSRELRAHIFPLIYRLDRCEPQDIAVIDHYLAVLVAQLQSESELNRGSNLLGNNVALSELWEDPAPSLDELKQRCDSLVLCPGAGVSIGQTEPYWPRYPQDAYVGKWPETDLPILSMNGTLDPQTPIGKAIAARDALRGEHQHFVSMPWSPHGVAFSSPVLTPGEPPCGATLIRGFLADPEAEPDTACLDDLAPPFAIKQSVATQFFGTTDLWENPASEPAQLLAAAGASLDGVDAHVLDAKPLGLNLVIMP